MLMLPARPARQPERQLVAAGQGGAPAATPGHRGDPLAPARGEPSAWMVVPAAAGVLALLVLGLHPPAELTDLFSRAVAILTGRAS
jgi:hypothetical protein